MPAHFLVIPIAIIKMMSFYFYLSGNFLAFIAIATAALTENGQPYFFDGASTAPVSDCE